MEFLGVALGNGVDEGIAIEERPGPAIERTNSSRYLGQLREDWLGVHSRGQPRGRSDNTVVLIANSHDATRLPVAKIASEEQR